MRENIYVHKFFQIGEYQAYSFIIILLYIILDTHQMGQILPIKSSQPSSQETKHEQIKYFETIQAKEDETQKVQLSSHSKLILLEPNTKVCQIIYKKITYPQFTARNPYETKILPDKEDSRLLKLAIKNNENMMMSITERVIVDFYLKSCIYKYKRQQFVEGFKVGLSLCQASDIRKKITQAEIFVTQHFMKQLIEGSNQPLMIFVNRTNLISKMYKAKNFYQFFYDEELKIQHQYWQKFLQDCRFFLEKIFKLVQLTQKQETIKVKKFNMYFGHFQIAECLNYLSAQSQQLGNDKERISSLLLIYRSFTNAILEQCQKFQPPLRVDKLNYYGKICQFLEKNKIFQGQDKTIFLNTRQPQLLKQISSLYFLYFYQNEKIANYIQNFLKKWKAVAEQNNKDLDNVEFQQEFNLLEENYNLCQYLNLWQLILRKHDKSLNQILSAFQNARFLDAKQQKQMIEYWLIRLSKQIVSIQKVLKGYGTDQLSKLFITRSQYLTKLKFKNQRQRLQFIFTTALAYRSIYEYALMIQYLNEVVTEEELEDLPVQREYFYFLVSIGYNQLNMSQKCLENLKKCRSALEKIQYQNLSQKSKIILLKRYQQNDYDNFMGNFITSTEEPKKQFSQDQNSKDLEILEKQKIKQILHYEKQIRNSELSLMFALQYRKIINRQEQQLEQQELDHIRDLELIQRQKFITIYRRYNFLDNWVECIKQEYQIISDQLHEYIEDNNTLSDKLEARKKKIIKRKTQRFQESVLIDNRRIRSSNFAFISDDIERAVFEKDVKKEDLFKSCEFIERWYKDFPKGTMKKLADNFYEIYYKKKYQALKSGINKEQFGLWKLIKERGPWKVYQHNKLYKQQTIYVYKINFSQENEHLYEKLNEKIRKLYNMRAQQIVQILHYQSFLNDITKQYEIYVYLPIPPEEKTVKFFSVKKILSSVISGLQKLRRQVDLIITAPQDSITIINRDHAVINPLQCQFEYESTGKPSLKQDGFLQELQTRITNESLKRAQEIPAYILKYFEYFRDYLQKNKISFIEKPEEVLKHYIFWNKYKLCKMIDQFCEVIDLQKKTQAQINCQLRQEVNTEAYSQKILFEQYRYKNEIKHNDGIWQNFLTEKQQQNLIDHVKQKNIKNSSEDVWIGGKVKTLSYYQLYDRYLRFVRNSVHHYLGMGGGGLKVACDIELIIKKEKRTPKLVDFMFSKWDTMEATKKWIYKPQGSKPTKRKQFKLP